MYTLTQMAGDAGFDEEDLNFKVKERKGAYLEGNLDIVHEFSCPAVAMVCRYSNDGSVLAVGLSDGSIKIYEPETGTLLHSLSDHETQTTYKAVTSLRFKPAAEDAKTEHKHLLLATYASGAIKLWHYTSGKCLSTIDESGNEGDRQTLASAFNFNGSYFLTGGSDGVINVYDPNTKEIVRICEPSDSRDIMNGHRQRIFSIQYHPAHIHTFVSGGWDNTVQIWDDRQKRAVRYISGPHLCGDALDIDPDHDHILTGSWRKDQVLQIWDFKSGKLIRNVPHDHMHQSLLYCAQWFGKDHIVCAGSEHNMARLIDRGTLNTVGQLVDLPQSVYCLDNNHALPKPRLAVGSDKTIYILKLEQNFQKRS